MRSLVAAGSVIVASILAGVCGGCEWGIPAFEPEPVPFVGVAPEFREVTGNELGASHGYVVGISPQRLAERDVKGAIDASLRGETVPTTQPVRTGGVEGAQAAAGPKPPGAVVYQRDAALRKQSEAVARSAMETDKSGAMLNPKSTIGVTQAESSEPVARPSQAKLPSSEPATAETADLNGDGFVTIDEIVAMQRAHVSSAEIAARLRATGYRLYATRTQLDHLAAMGVEPEAVEPLRQAPVSVKGKLAETEMR